MSLDTDVQMWIDGYDEDDPLYPDDDEDADKDESEDEEI